MAKPKPETATSLTTYLEAIKNLAGDGSLTYVFRGHESQRFKLRPSIFRTKWSKAYDAERSLIRTVVTKHPDDFSNDSNTFEKLVRMQHYGIPTRLLDVTHNTLVALYFACSNTDKSSININADVMMIGVKSEAIKSYDSDTVRCLTNLCHLSTPEKDIIKHHDRDQLKLCKKGGQRLIDFISQERPNFDPRIEPNDLKSFYLVDPKLSNPRIRSQSGAFIVFGLEPEITSSAKNYTIKRIRIPKEYKANIITELASIGIDKTAIYPSLETTAEIMMKKYEN